MPYLIDGHNLIPKLGLRLDSIDDEMELISILQEFCRRDRRQVEVYFDGAPAPHAGTRKLGAVTAHFVRLGITADHAIRSRLKTLGKSAKHWTVVSSDRQVQADASAARAEVLSSDSFATLLKQARDVAPKAARERKLSESEVNEWLRLFQKGKPSDISHKSDKTGSQLDNASKISESSLRKDTALREESLLDDKSGVGDENQELVTYIIDGENLLHYFSQHPIGEFVRYDTDLLSLLDLFANKRNCHIDLILDQPFRSEIDALGSTLQVFFSSTIHSTIDIFQDRIAFASKGNGINSVVIVSSDREIQDLARSQATKFVETSTFSLDLLLIVDQKRIKAVMARDGELFREELEKWLNHFHKKLQRNSQKEIPSAKIDKLTRPILSRWSVSNFKSIGTAVDIELGAVTILSGMNSAGKSSFLQSILMLNETN